eukprot:gnl/MRDRNA2_/MRDRNA2_27846_c0_seq1.p1 gnl/MRDRNA2_/MRDRNA2_27846_c0~~gnl/MRDRNA2_/MRDRNA2_27846_c0_seq1.p1  ORF type:complete len:347 (-),score=25.73 gnl/MRDRNA2_/MRDRNA2_27846_c0_seq1:416-1363(-)
MSSGRISLPRGMDPKQKDTIEIASSLDTSHRLQSIKDHSADIVSHLAEVSSPLLSPITAHFRNKRRGSTGDGLQRLGDIGGLDSPTIMRYGSQWASVINEDQADAPSTLNQGSFMRKTASTPQLKNVGASSIASRRQQNPELKSMGASIVVSGTKNHVSYADASPPTSPMTPMRRHSDGGHADASPPASPMTPIRRHSDGGYGSGQGRSVTKDFSSKRRTSSISDMTSVTSSIESRRQSLESHMTSWRKEMSDDVRVVMSLDKRIGVQAMTVKAFHDNLYKVDHEPVDSPKGQLRHTESYRYSRRRKRKVFNEAN